METCAFFRRRVQPTANSQLCSESLKSPISSGIAVAALTLVLSKWCFNTLVCVGVGICAVRTEETRRLGAECARGLQPLWGSVGVLGKQWKRRAVRSRFSVWGGLDRGFSPSGGSCPRAAGGAAAFWQIKSKSSASLPKNLGELGFIHTSV